MNRRSVPDEQLTAERAGQFWRDQDGFLSPIRPGEGPRRNPEGEFPTGPAIGTKLPEIVALDSSQRAFDVHADRGSRAAIVVFHRSAVW